MDRESIGTFAESFAAQLRLVCRGIGADVRLGVESHDGGALKLLLELARRPAVVPKATCATRLPSDERGVLP